MDTGIDLSPLTNLKPSTKDGREYQKVFADFLESYDFKIKQILKDMQQDFEKKFAEQATVTQKLTDEVRALKSQVQKLEDQAEEKDTASRQDTIVLSGASLPDATNNEDCRITVTNVLREKLTVNLQSSEIAEAYRPGKPVIPGNANSRKFMAKLKDCDARKDILASARVYKPSNFYVSENLTPQRQKIAYVLRQARKKFPEVIFGTTTRNGAPCVWVKPTGRSAGGQATRLRIATRSTLAEFGSKTLGKELSEFMPEWRE